MEGGVLMVKEIDRSSKSCNIERVLVCITAQSNSKRLINKGAEVADLNNGELHILHVEKGNNIFDNEDAPRLLQELFHYGSEKGGMVHAYCDDNIPESIARFVENENITKIVLGEAPAFLKLTTKEMENQFYKIICNIPRAIEIFIVDREENEELVENLKYERCVI